MSKKSFSKPALSLQDQLALLDSRGLNIEDQDEALELLQHNNYYRLEGYWYPFYDANVPNHQFKKGVSIKQVANFYKFDIKLRELVFSAISTIEVSFRSKFAYQLAMDFGPFPFDNNNCFHFSNAQDEQDTKEKIEDEARKSKEEFIQHFYANYSDDLPPIWMLVEILTFGEISTFYEYYLNNKSRKQIAKSYGVTDSSVMSSWIRQLCIVRNVCAHHARLWNKVISITPAFPSKLDNPEFVPLFLTTRDSFDNYRRIYNVLVFIQYLLYKITGEKTEFLKKVKNLVAEHSISIQRMGFPNNSSLDDIIKTLKQ